MKKFSHGIVAATLFFGGIAVGSQSDTFYSDKSSETIPAMSQLFSSENSQLKGQNFGELAARLSPSVVHISVQKSTNNPFMGAPAGQGSGVLISSDGEILTNHHVIAGAANMTVKLSDGNEYEAELLGTDSQTDLALIKLKGASDLPAADLGDSEKIGVGDWVMAIGNPFGLESTVTVGVLSGKGRVIGAGPYDDFLQTDASINPGNSGGPLFNTKGEVVGINTAIIRDGQGIGFSIPINLAKKIAADLRAEGVVERGFLGIGVQSLNTRIRQSLELQADAKGALVASVSPNGPAQRAGLEPGDLIVSIDDQEIKSDRELLATVADLPVGETVKVRYLRDGQKETASVTLAERPSPEKKLTNRVERPTRKLRLGVELSPGLKGYGVFVNQVFPGSAAHRSGLLDGDTILEIGTQKVDDPSQFLALLKATPKNEVTLLVDRNGTTRFVSIEER